MNPEFDEFLSFVNRADELRTTSLSQYTKPAVVSGPVFVQSKVVEETIIGDLLDNLYNLYMGYIMVALKLKDRIDGTTTVRDYLSTVSSSANISAVEFLDSSKLIDGFESGNIVAGSEASGNVTDPKRSAPVPSGRLFEISVNTDTGKPIDVYLSLNLTPRYFPDDLVEYLISAKLKESTQDRWFKMKAGELRFFHDFILNLDKLETRSKALRNDKDNALRDIFRHGKRSTFRQLLNLVLKNRTFNIANAIVIMDEADVTKACKKLNLDFTKPKDRQKFFNSTFSLFMVLVDSRYSEVTIYTNAIDHGATYSYSELKGNANSSKVDVMQMMEFISKNQMPKF